MPVVVVPIKDYPAEVVCINPELAYTGTTGIACRSSLEVSVPYLVAHFLHAFHLRVSIAFL